MRQTHAIWAVGWIMAIVIGAVSFKTAPWLLWSRLAEIGSEYLMFAPVVAGLYLARLYERWHQRPRP
jgi:hypothetical protein